MSEKERSKRFRQRGGKAKNEMIVLKTHEVDAVTKPPNVGNDKPPTRRLSPPSARS